ncbi:MAG TPA: DUF2510 domain-containing protein [Acidimicrobiales bacterium]|nr:DUF2510 domain-containing protein [Acidimicrobiales bacterium]
MAIRDSMRANAAPYLQPGETVQAVFAAQTTSQWFALISYWIIIITNAYRVVVVTDRRIMVCKSGRFRMTPVNSVLRELPRATRIGPFDGRLWYKSESLGERLYIARRFQKDIDLADSMLAGAQAAPASAGTWAADPSGRHEQRYWDGSVWTEHVQSGGVQSTDPI